VTAKTSLQVCGSGANKCSSVVGVGVGIDMMAHHVKCES
jgi:hypothetical protein